jgi:signal transduction histidine kinase
MSQVTSLNKFSELIEAAASVVGETDLAQVLRRLVTEARTATGAPYAALGVIGEHGVLSEFIYEGITPEDAAKIGNLPTGQGVLGTVVRLNKTIRLEEISNHPDTVGFPPNHPPMKAFLGVPVAVGDTAFGNLYLTDKEGGFTDEDVILIEALSRIAGSAVRTGRLQDRLRRMAVMEDRQRIARDLHDSVIQDLFAVGLGLQGVAQLVDEPQAEATIVDAVDRLDGAVETLRSYIFDLKATRIQPALSARLDDLVNQMSSAYPTTVRLRMGAEETGDDGLDSEILRIVTETLSNALRHASARNVEISIQQVGDRWVIRVEDDGIGFDVDAASSGMGLGNLRARVTRLGGDLSVASQQGSGTEVLLTLPVT